MSVRFLAIRGETAYVNCEKQQDATRLTNAVAFSFSHATTDFGVKVHHWTVAGMAVASYEGVTMGDVKGDVHTYNCPWREPLPPGFFLKPSGRHLFLPAYGWKGGVWYDAPLVYTEAKRIISYVTEGAPVAFPLGTPHRVGLQDGAELQGLTDSGRLTSLVCASRLLFSSLPASILIDLCDFSLKSLVSLVIVKKAFLAAELHVRAADQTYKSWPPAVKRLCQNLGLNLYDAKADAGGVLLDMARLSAQLAGYEHKLAHEINRRSAVIPPSLFSS